MSTVGENILRMRKRLGWTQEELATKMGYKSKSTINKIELGINDIPQSKIVKFADVLGTTPAYLMGWDTESSAPQNASNQNASEFSLILTKKEATLLKLFRNTSKSKQDLVISMLAEFSSDTQKKAIHASLKKFTAATVKGPNTVIEPIGIAQKKVESSLKTSPYTIQGLKSLPVAREICDRSSTFRVKKQIKG